MADPTYFEVTSIKLGAFWTGSSDHGNLVRAIRVS